MAGELVNIDIVGGGFCEFQATKNGGEKKYDRVNLLEILVHPDVLLLE